MLRVNGLRVNWDAAAALRYIVQMAEGQLTPADFAAWLPTVSTTPTLAEDAAVDTAIIAEIMTEHAELLAELALR
jgi:hypothetical protein